jgi:small subunit ribosomal protein S3
MGQKIHPKLFRLNTIYDWDSKWFAKKDKYIDSLREDVQLREFIKKQLKDAAVDSVIIDRNSNKVNVTIISAKPGFVIGRAGAGIEELKRKINKKFYAGKKVSLNINVKEVHNPSLSSAVVGQQIANEVERRLPFRRSMKMALERIMKAGAKGAKIQIAGRLNGADIARTETVSQGSIPLHNLRADIDYAHVEANTIWGTIGVKTWIFRGEVFDKAEVKKTVVEKPRRKRRRN